MLIENREGVFKVDGKEVIKDVRLNVVGKQFRLKFIGIINGKEIPVDISCLNMSTGIGAKGLRVEAHGMENARRLPFDILIEKPLIGSEWQILIKINGKQQKFVSSAVTEVMFKTLQYIVSML